MEILERDKYKNVIISIDYHSAEMSNLYKGVIFEYQLKFAQNITVIKRDKNLGIAKHLPTALDEIFLDNETAIIFEDDIIVGPGAISSFIKANEILQQDESIFTIGGFTFSIWPLMKVWKNKWRKTRYFSAWGWMTNRNQWASYKQSLSAEDVEKLFLNISNEINLTKKQKIIWLSRFIKCKEVEEWTWDIPMQYWTFVTGKHHLLPNFRLLDNEGFNNPESTNTKSLRPRWMFNPRFMESTIEPSYERNTIAKVMQYIDSLTIAGDRNISKFRSIFIFIKPKNEIG
jgi:hypothetical protein